jgi:hypothetical protein
MFTQIPATNTAKMESADDNNASARNYDAARDLDAPSRNHGDEESADVLGIDAAAEEEDNASSGFGEEDDEDDNEPRWWKACERCGQDRKLWVHPHGYWYCEMNPDLSAPRCEPTANCPLRVKGAAGQGLRAATNNGFSDLSDEHVAEMLSTFSKLKQAATDQEYVLASGWKASYKKRKRGDGGDAYITKEGEQALRSVADVRRRFGLPMV